MSLKPLHSERDSTGQPSLRRPPGASWRRWLMTAFVLNGLIAGSANSADVPVIGAGSFSCERMLAVSKQLAEDNDIEISFSTWVQGFLTGLNFGKVVYAEEIAEQFVQAAPDRIETWLRQFCEENPETNLVDAAYRLFLELERTTP